VKIFSCSSCGQFVFFENVQCTRCGKTLAYLPESQVVSVMEPAGNGVWRALAPAARRTRHRLCMNYTEQSACNWAVEESDPESLCRSCRLDRVIPDLRDAGTRAAWIELEQAKRRLLFTLMDLGLPLSGKEHDPGGLAFVFLADEPGKKVVTGHSDGLITINVAEANPAFREKTRVALGEAYRTLLGHFRHEVGHYYWDRLVQGDPSRLSAFRRLFGDETADYQAAVQRHYEDGPAANWQTRFVSAYASMHPWEDWAETWAHYLHIVDTLQTAEGYGMAIRSKAADAGVTGPRVDARHVDFESIDALIEQWLPLTWALNSLNRSMGVADPYPFVLAAPALEKLRFVHDVVAACRVDERGR
jgi:hypothetical protein